MVHLYSQCFTTLTLTGVVCKGIYVFILWLLFCISVEVFSSNLRYPYACLIEQSQRTNPVSYCCTVHLELPTETQDRLQCLQTYPLHEPEMPARQLSCMGLRSYPSLRLFLLGGVCCPRYVLLWTGTHFFLHYFLQPLPSP